MSLNLHGQKGVVDPETEHIRYYYVYVDKRRFEGQTPQQIQESIDHELAELRMLMAEELIT